MGNMNNPKSAGGYVIGIIIWILFWVAQNL